VKSKYVITNFDNLVITNWGARFRGQTYACSIGRGGIGEKLGEGDGITPKGSFELLEVLYRPDRIDLGEFSVPCRPIGIMDIWSDDPRDPYYNHPRTALDYPFSHENLRRPDPLYDAIGVLDFNYPQAKAGKGSAIFLHIWRKPRHPTEGCIAFDPLDFAEILMHWNPKSRVVIK